MPRKILIREARQLLTLHGPTGPRRGAALQHLALIEHGSVLIVNGSIVAVGPTRRVENLAEARTAEEINAAGKVVLPGFIDSHTHLIGGATRAIMHAREFDDNTRVTLQRGAMTIMRGVRVTPGNTLRAYAHKLLYGFVRHGTTTIEAKSGYGLDSSSELKMLRVFAGLDGAPIDVIPTFFGANFTPPEFEGRAAEYIDWLCADLMPIIAKRRLARFADVNCEAGGFSIEEARRYLKAATAFGMIPKIQACQSGRTEAIRLGVEMQAASVDGVNEAAPEDADLLARSPTIATLMPGAVFQGKHRQYAPGRLLIDRGAAVALASGFDHIGSASFNLQMTVALACTQMGMTPAESISAATINAAHALRISHRTGSLEYGKDADLIMLNASDYREIPYYFGVNLVSLTMKRGEILYKEADIVEPKNN